MLGEVDHVHPRVHILILILALGILHVLLRSLDHLCVRVSFLLWFFAVLRLGRFFRNTGCNRRSRIRRLRSAPLLSHLSHVALRESERLGVSQGCHPSRIEHLRSKRHWRWALQRRWLSRNRLLLLNLLLLLLHGE